ncbi:hypothetical protein Pelo_15531 [Pelomyxa schiedti]|nr:hypothetical protein Pelo_15531 [Pelomyxa schiedti]
MLWRDFVVGPAAAVPLVLVAKPPRHARCGDKPPISLVASLAVSASTLGVCTANHHYGSGGCYSGDRCGRDIWQVRGMSGEERWIGPSVYLTSDNSSRRIRMYSKCNTRGCIGVDVGTLGSQPSPSDSEYSVNHNHRNFKKPFWETNDKWAVDWILSGPGSFTFYDLLLSKLPQHDQNGSPHQSASTQENDTAVEIVPTVVVPVNGVPLSMIGVIVQLNKLDPGEALLVSYEAVHVFTLVDLEQTHRTGKLAVLSTTKCPDLGEGEYLRALIMRKTTGQVVFICHNSLGVVHVVESITGASGLLSVGCSDMSQVSESLFCLGSIHKHSYELWDVNSTALPVRCIDPGDNFWQVVGGTRGFLFAVRGNNKIFVLEALSGFVVMMSRPRPATEIGIKSARATAGNCRDQFASFVLCTHPRCGAASPPRLIAATPPLLLLLWRDFVVGPAAAVPLVVVAVPRRHGRRGSVRAGSLVASLSVSASTLGVCDNRHYGSGCRGVHQVRGVSGDEKWIGPSVYLSRDESSSVITAHSNNNNIRDCAGVGVGTLGSQSSSSAPLVEYSFECDSDFRGINSRWAVDCTPSGRDSPTFYDLLLSKLPQHAQCGSTHKSASTHESDPAVEIVPTVVVPVDYYISLSVHGIFVELNNLDRDEALLLSYENLFGLAVFTLVDLDQTHRTGKLAVLSTTKCPTPMVDAYIRALIVRKRTGQVVFICHNIQDTVYTVESITGTSTQLATHCTDMSQVSESLFCTGFRYSQSYELWDVNNTAHPVRCINHDDHFRQVVGGTRGFLFAVMENNKIFVLEALSGFVVLVIDVSFTLDTINTQLSFL